MTETKTKNKGTADAVITWVLMALLYLALTAAMALAEMIGLGVMHRNGVPVPAFGFTACWAASWTAVVVLLILRLLSAPGELR